MSPGPTCWMGERRGKGLQDLITPDLQDESRSSRAITRGHRDTANKQTKKNTPALCKSSPRLSVRGRQVSVAVQSLTRCELPSCRAAERGCSPAEHLPRERFYSGGRARTARHTVLSIGQDRWMKTEPFISNIHRDLKQEPSCS